MQPDGLIWHSTPRATVGLVVSGGVVVDAPPYARKWALHRPAAELLNDPQADTAWIPERSSMTDTMPEQTTEDEQDWTGPTTGETYPSYPDNPHNHRFTISFDGRGPMVVVRGNTKDEIIQAYNELEDHAVGAAMGNAWAALKAAAALGNGLGATPVPNGAPAAPQAPTPPPFGPNVSVPGAPGFQGNPGFPPAGAPAFPAPPAQGGFGGGQQANSRGPKPRPADWPQVYKVTVPFAQKDAFKALREQHKDVLRGKVAWAGAGDYWIHGEVVSGFAAYNPVPA